MAVMEGGEIRQFGPPQEIYDRPADLFVAGFIGSPSMNFIKSQAMEDSAGVGLRLQSGDGDFLLPLRQAGDAMRP
jgi:multiple sugar transport system ATP-binding protein